MIGSREWMNLSNGNLSFKEKVQLIKTVLLPALTGYGKTFLKPDAAPIALKLKDFKIPDTAIVKEAIAELEQTQSKAIIHGELIFGASQLLKKIIGSLMMKVFLLLA